MEGANGAPNSPNKTLAAFVREDADVIESNRSRGCFY
jgi:hypothetical protein